MRKLSRAPVWLAVAVVALGLAAWGLTLERADKLASIGSFVIAAVALVAAARTYLRPAEAPGATQTNARATYKIHNEVSAGGRMNVWSGDNATVHLIQQSGSQRHEGEPKPDRE